MVGRERMGKRVEWGNVRPSSSSSKKVLKTMGNYDICSKFEREYAVL